MGMPAWKPHAAMTIRVVAKAQAPSLIHDLRARDFLEQQLVSATTGIGGRFGMMKHHLPRRRRRRLQPDSDGERIRPRKMSKARKSKPALPVQQRGLAMLARNQFRRFSSSSKAENDSI